MSDLNDPRVFFAAERTLLAWTRTSITVMVFGFVVERFGLLAQMMLPKGGEIIQRNIFFGWVSSSSSLESLSPFSPRSSTSVC